VENTLLNSVIMEVNTYIKERFMVTLYHSQVLGAHTSYSSTCFLLLFWTVVITPHVCIVTCLELHISFCKLYGIISDVF